MQKNDFEKHVQQQLQDFSILPGDAVWENVAAKIEADKRRRRILFFWLFSAILLLGGGSGLYMLGDKEEIKTSANSDESKTNALKVEVEKLENHKSANEHKPGADQRKMIEEKTIGSKESEPGDKKKYLTQGSKQTGNSYKRTINSTRRVEKLEPSLVEKLQGRIKDVEMPFANIESIKKEALGRPSSTISSSSTLIATPANSEAIEKIATVNPEEKTVKSTNENKIQSNKVANRNVKPWLFGLSIAGGISDNVSSSFFPTTKSAERTSQFSGPLASQGFVADVAQYNYSSNVSWGVGGFIQKAFSKNFSISVGINYQLSSVTSKVGTRVDSAKIYQDSALQKITVVNVFYRGGTINKIKNSYHLLHVPVNALLQLNRNADKPLIFSAGISGHFLVGSDALYLNTKARSFYEEDNHLKHFMLGLQTGLTFTLYNNKDYRFHAGPTFQYQVSNLTKPAISTNEHLLFAGLKANILFKKNK